MASISHRYSIRWLPQAATEPTSTLVLTLASGAFIDIRVNNQDSSNPPKCLPANVDNFLSAPPEAAEDDSRSNVEMDWAFAGMSDVDNGPPQRCTWRHQIDSKTNLLDGKPIADSGIMVKQPDGLVLESGSMLNPSTGVETEYEELWEDIRVQNPKHHDYEYYLFQNDAGYNEGNDKMRGAAIMLGSYYQAIHRQDTRESDGKITTRLAVTRWKWDDKRKSWNHILTHDNGNGKVPAPLDFDIALDDEYMAPGMSIYLDGRLWTCRELKRTEYKT